MCPALLVNLDTNQIKMENIGSSGGAGAGAGGGGGGGYNCDISLVPGHPALHGHKYDNNKGFSVNHLLDLPGQAHLYHSHHGQVVDQQNTRIQSHEVKISEGR